MLDVAPISSFAVLACVQLFFLKTTTQQSSTPTRLKCAVKSCEQLRRMASCCWCMAVHPLRWMCADVLLGDTAQHSQPTHRITTSCCYETSATSRFQLNKICLTPMRLKCAVKACVSAEEWRSSPKRKKEKRRRELSAHRLPFS